MSENFNWELPFRKIAVSSKFYEEIAKAKAVIAGRLELVQNNRYNIYIYKKMFGSRENFGLMRTLCLPLMEDT